VFVVADACGGLTVASHELALRRLEQAGARLCSWIQVLLEFQRDWTRHTRTSDWHPPQGLESPAMSIQRGLNRRDASARIRCIASVS